jgi:hypothetical protein
MILIYKNLKYIDFKNEKLIKVFFIYKHTDKVKKGGGGERVSAKSSLSRGGTIIQSLEVP